MALTLSPRNMEFYPHSDANDIINASMRTDGLTKLYSPVNHGMMDGVGEGSAFAHPQCLRSPHGSAEGSLMCQPSVIRIRTFHILLVSHIRGNYRHVIERGYQCSTLYRRLSHCRAVG